jgi:hypothetical protein
VGEAVSAVGAITLLHHRHAAAACSDSAAAAVSVAAIVISLVSMYVTYRSVRATKRIPTFAPLTDAERAKWDKPPPSQPGASQ